MRKNKKKNYIGLGLLFLIGLSILLYPMVSDAWNRYRDSLLISNYSSSVSSDDNSEKIDSMWKAAQEYNEQIKQESVPVICSAAVFRLAARVPIVFCRHTEDFQVRNFLQI